MPRIPAPRSASALPPLRGCGSSEQRACAAGHSSTRSAAYNGRGLFVEAWFSIGGVAWCGAGRRGDVREGRGDAGRQPAVGGRCQSRGRERGARAGRQVPDRGQRGGVGPDRAEAGGGRRGRVGRVRRGGGRWPLAVSLAPPPGRLRAGEGAWPPRGRAAPFGQ